MLLPIVQQSYYLRLEGESGPTFSVHSFQIEEELGRPYVINLTLTSPLPDYPGRQLLGTQASFFITKSTIPGLPGPGVEREWFGVVRSFRRLIKSADETRYQCQIVPRLEKLTRSTHCRLFQNQTLANL